jgi:hypothetical protein
MDEVFADESYDTGDPRLKGRFYDLTDKPTEIDTLYNAITEKVSPTFSGTVTRYEFEGMSFPFYDKYRNKQCSWSKYSDIDQEGYFTIGVHLLNDMVWMDHRRYGTFDEARFSELEPSSTPFRSLPVRGVTQGKNGIMDYDLFGFGPNWRTEWFNNLTPGIYGGVTCPIPTPDGTTSPTEDKRYFYEPHPKNMWGNPLIGGYTAGNSGYWDARLQLNFPTNYEVKEVYKMYVDQENEPNDLGHTESLGFTYDNISSQWTIDVPNIGMHAFVAIKVQKLQDQLAEQFIGRPPIVAWGGLPYGVFFGNPTAYTSGDTGNYVISSTDLFHPSWNIGAGAVGTYGHTAPDETLTAWAITGNRGQHLNIPLGHTYIYSYYINLSAGVTGPTRVDAYVIDGANRLAFRQILPYEAASPSITPYTVYPNDGITGWRRFAYEFYIPDKNSWPVYFTMLYMDNWSGKVIHFWGPQIEKIS